MDCNINKKAKQKRSNWKPPKNYRDYFSRSSDDTFKSAHPIGYVFLVLFGIIALLLPLLVFVFICASAKFDSYWILLGAAGGFIFGIGLFNFIAIIIGQYLGHWVSIISFLLGGVLMLISWLLCQ